MGTSKIKYGIVSERCHWVPDSDGRGGGFHVVVDGTIFDQAVEEFLEDTGYELVGGVSVVADGDDAFILSQACMIASFIDR